MKVLVATTAGAGHVAGLLPFARACAQAGHEVRVAAPRSFAGSVQRAGFAHEPLPDADPAALGAVFARIPALTMDEADDLVIQEVFGRLDLQAALPGMREVVDRWRPDAVLREPAELSSYVVAQERDVPHVQANIGLSSLDDRLLPLLDAPLGEVGSDPAGLRTAPRWTTVPPSFDADAQLVSGPLLHARDPDLGGDGAAPLPDWWDGSNDPLVYLSFGSVAAGLGLFPTFYAAVLEQLRDLPVRVLLTLGEGVDPGALGPLSSNVHVEPWWPQQEVMPHASLVVGHGGFGTTQGGLVSAVPQVVVPLFSFDQFANARRVAAVGLGIALLDEDVAQQSAAQVVPHGPRAVRRLAQAVTAVLEDDGATRTAREVAAEVAALPPAASCVATLETMTTR